MAHVSDPRSELQAQVGDVSHVDVFGNWVMVAIYKRPEKTKGGIILTDTTRKEDDYQGKVGLVLKKGPMAFVNDSRVDFAGKTVEPGDWIAFRASDGWDFLLRGPKEDTRCRMIADVDVRMMLTDPDAVF